jgi:predicted nucleic acid-binding protein
MDVVINASPLIFLYKIKRLDVLPKIFDTIYIPQAVSREIESGNSTEAKNLLSSIPHKIIEVTNLTAVLGLLGRLHIGEVEVIVGAIEKGISKVVLDDMYARNKAKQLKLEVTGTLGILLRARELGLIDNINKDIEGLKRAGMYLSDKIIERVLNF